jgi:multidrug efflux pump subunit AcrA (membrane-fusion protein)
VDRLADVNGEPTLTERVRGLRLPTKVDSTGGGNLLLPWALCLLLGASTASLAVAVYRQPAANPNAPLAASPTPAAEGKAGTKADNSPASAGSTAAPKVAPGEPILVQKGYITPAHQIAVSPIEASGQILKLCPNQDGREFGEGTRYRRNDPLAILDSTPFEAEYREAEANLLAGKARLAELEASFALQVGQADAELRETQANLKSAEFEFTRSKNIRGSALADREFETAEASFRSLEQRVNRLKIALELIKINTPRKIDALKAEVQQGEARLKRSKWRLENCTIRAPIDGTLLSKKAEIGNLINPLAFGATSGSLCEMADLSDLEVDIEVPERDLSKVFAGQRCEVRVDAYSDRLYKGVVDRIMPIAKRANGSVAARVKVQVPKDEEGVYLKPEMGALVNFLAGPPAQK